MGEQLSVSARIRRHIRHNLWGILAVFIALGGTAAALPGTNSVDSRDIKNRNVRRADLAPGAVDSSRVLDNSLTGADIAESSLSLPALPATLPPSGPAGGDLSGDFPDPQVRETGLDLGGDLTGTAADAQIGPDTIGDAEARNSLQEIYVPAQDLYAQTGSIPAASSGLINGHIPTRDFDQATDEAILAEVQLPEERQGGDALTALIRSTAASAGAVDWRVDTHLIGPGDSVTGGFVTGTPFALSQFGSSKLDTTCCLPLGSPQGNNSVLLIRLVRLASDSSDTIASDVRVLGVDVRYHARR
jgi:hypothetical protein